MSDQDIYISSIAFLGVSYTDMIGVCRRNSWALEFSSGMPYAEDMETRFINCDLKRMPHNYFPAPKVPFVLNLASADDGIREISIEHCKQGLRLSKLAESPFFAAHAGFCVDPDPRELGQQIRIRQGFDRERHYQIFLESLRTILSEAERLETPFLIENNVIAGFNMAGDVNPLLCCESEDISRLFDDIGNGWLGLLLDTAHLKVSAATLGLELKEELEDIKEFVKGLHHSDNDSTVDDNQILLSDYWFLPYLQDYKDVPHVIEVKKLDETQIADQMNLLRNGC